MTLRTETAVRATAALNRLSRQLRLGRGTVAGGRLGLAIAPQGLAELAAGRSVALVSGTNGKTTTTALLTAALGENGAVVSNSTGSNMPPGHFAALAGASRRAPAVLEVDEAYLPVSLETLGPGVVVLLNLSRDQLDRSNEVRMVAGRWHRALARTEATVVANADDPLVAYGAESAPSVLWVAGGARWRADAVGCPACGERIEFTNDSWSCRCGFARPQPQVSVEEGPDRTTAELPDGRRLEVALSIPGSFNRRNAVMAMVGAEALGVSPEVSLAAMARIEAVAGRFSVRLVGGVPTRLLLAKNPAGWEELLDVVTPGSGPVVVAINARIADGRDPSWLWDVPFERLSGRPVVASGERSADVSVRLHYAGVEHERRTDPVEAVVLAARMGGEDVAKVQFIGNYTAFGDIVGAVA
jgi:UDP-N-acetylmuramyl tripeptide synthase